MKNNKKSNYHIEEHQLSNCSECDVVPYPSTIALLCYPEIMQYSFYCPLCKKRSDEGHDYKTSVSKWNKLND